MSSRPSLLRRPRLAAAGLSAGLALAATVGLAGSAAGGVAVGNAGFESWSSSSPTCWKVVGSGTATSTLAPTSTAHSGSRAAQLSVSGMTSGSRKLIVDQRAAGCPIPVVAGHSYRLTFWYRSTAAPIVSLYYLDGGGTWRWWAQSAPLSPASAWTQASYDTWAIPAGATAVSYGPALISNGTLLVDDAAVADLTAAASAVASPAISASVAVTTSAAPTAAPSPTVSTSSAAPTTTSASPTASGVLNVSTAAQLASALSMAVPGTTIHLADGTYSGHFTLSRSGTSSAPITVTGSRNAVLDGGSTGSGYVLHLDRASWVNLQGFTVRNGQKAVVLDQATHNTLSGLDASHTGEEVVLLRNYSSDNTITGCDIHDSGHSTPGYGEGVYVGLAVSNWSSSGQSRTGGGPDTSDRTSILGNHIWATTAENVDIKEGTSNGLVAGNTFDATGMSGANYADSWVDVAGNGWTIRDNTGLNPGSALLDGYQTHVQAAGWGERNVFSGNRSAVNAGGYAININTRGAGNVVTSTNTQTGAGRGLTNIPVTP